MSRTSVLAKLLATENIDVVYKGTRTAAFDVVNRVLYMPIWKEISKDLEDLLTGHEVGHALFTPSEGWHESDKSFDFPRAYINVIEDIRIERMIQNKYPGLKGSFKRGYMELIERDFFGTADREMSELGFMDRLNIKAKARNLMDIPFNEDEIPYVKLAMGVETFEDVLNACQVIYDWLKEQKENESKATSNEPQQVQEQDESDDFESSSSDTEVESVSDEESQTESDKSDSSEKSDKSTESDSQDSGKDSNDSDNETEKKSEPVKSSGTEGNIDDVLTDDAFRNNEDKLLETNRRGDLPTASTGVSKKTIKQVIVPYAEAIQIRKDNTAAVLDREPLYRVDLEDAVKQFNVFMDESKKTVNTMAKEFEMRKAAFQHARATTAKSGSLDVTKLHSYKFTDDLFLRTTTLADAKNHGLVAIIDFSGSMQDVLRNVVDQAIVLAMFCRKVGIPFEIYSFTTTGWSVRRDTWETQKDGEIDCSQVHIVQQLSSKMSKSEFFAAAESLYVAYTRDRWSMPFLSYIDNLGGTPLNETLIIMNEIMKEFKVKNAVQKVNFITITDGEGGWLNVAGASGWGYNDIHVRMNNTNVKLERSSRSAGTVELLEAIRKTGVNVVGYFIISNLREVRTRYWYNNDYDTMRKDLREKKIAEIEQKGYDTYFILDGRQDAVNDEFEVKDDAKKGDIVRAFKKFTKSKKGNRAMAVQFAKAVA